jgi:hypothetical protein
MDALRVWGACGPSAQRSPDPERGKHENVKDFALSYTSRSRH